MYCTAKLSLYSFGYCLCIQENYFCSPRGRCCSKNVNEQFNKQNHTISVFGKIFKCTCDKNRSLVESGMCFWVPFQRWLNHRGPKLHSSHIKSVRVLFLSRHRVCFSSHVSFSELLKVCVLVWLIDSVLYLECDVVERQTRLLSCAACLNVDIWCEIQPLNETSLITLIALFVS